MRKLILALGVVACGGAALALGPDDKNKAGQAKISQEEVIAAQLPLYPVDKCLVSDEPLDAMGEPLDYVHEGRLVRFCCKSCVRMFKKDPAGVLEQLDEAAVKQQVAAYPLKTCVVSGEPLDAMGSPLDLVHEGRLVRFCCKGCLKGLKKDPAKLMKDLDQAYIAAQVPSYPLDTCFMSGEPLGDAPKDLLYGNRLVRFCCGRCAKKFQAAPTKMIARLDDAAKKPAKRGY